MAVDRLLRAASPLELASLDVWFRSASWTHPVAPDFQNIVVEDISNTSLGHLNKGLLAAHGYDEGGQKALGIGGHDDMWFAVRDALFGKDAYPICGATWILVYQKQKDPQKALTDLMAVYDRAHPKSHLKPDSTKS